MLSELWQDTSYRLAALLLATTVCLDVLLRRVRARMERDPAADTETAVAPGTRRAWLEAIVPPLSLVVWFYGAYGAASVVAHHLPEGWGRAEWWLENAAGAGASVAVLWLLFRVARVIEEGLRARAARTDSGVDDVLLPLFGAGLRLVPPVLALFFLVRLWPLEPSGEATVRRLAAVVMILGLAWLALRAARLVENVVVERSGAQALKTLEGRAVVTRVRLLRRVVTFLVGVFALAAVLMLFDEVRDVGRSLLASAGVAGLIIGFAAQRSIGGIFAGLQIALTQPVRLGDIARVAGETGVVEEITLTHVALQIWDGRRLIVPVNHLIENPVVNLTKVAAPQVGVVMLRVDFLLPVAEFRAFMREAVETMPQWDKGMFGVDLVDTLANCMEIRVIASAADPGAAFGLGCGLRERAIGFVRERYPHCLPKIRQERAEEAKRAAAPHEPAITEESPETWR